MNARDEQAEEELIRCPETGDNLIDSVNRYLEKCSNVCRITLSANIITSDDVLLLCRHTGDNALYPCVYGETELRADCRDFREDAGRQTYEWLREILPYQEWDCCGVIICGSHPYPEQFCSPLEFSILFEQQSERDYIEIENRSGTSAGSSEIDELPGVSVKCYKNPLSKIGYTLQSLFTYAADQKDVIESFLVLMLFFASLRSGGSEEGWSGAVSLVLSVIIISLTLHNLYVKLRRGIHMRRQIRPLLIYQEINRETKDRKLHDVVRDCAFHPAAYAVLKAHTDRKAYQTFFSPEDEQAG